MIAYPEVVSRQGLAAMLRQHEGIEVVSDVDDGIQAIINAVTCRPDVILMDICLPLMGVFEIADRIKKNIPDIKVLMLGISEQEQSLLETVPLQVDGYVSSTVTSNELVDIIRKVVSSQPLLPSNKYKGSQKIEER